MRVANAERVRTSVEKILILARSEEHVRAMQTPVNANVQQKVPLRNAMAKIRELLESSRSIDWYNYSVKISKLTGVAQQLTGPVKSKDLELQTMPGLVEEVSHLREKLYKLNGDKDSLTAENNVVFVLLTKIPKLKRTNTSLVSFFQEVNGRVVETERDVGKA